MAEREGRTRAGYIAAREIQFRVISRCGQVTCVRTMYVYARPFARSNATLNSLDSKGYRCSVLKSL